ncbi:hypothetical protein K3495_g16859, partial [Podosphaera aphanis]
QYRIFNPQDKRIIRSADVKFIPFSNKNKDCELSLNQTEQLTDSPDQSRTVSLPTLTQTIAPVNTSTVSDISITNSVENQNQTPHIAPLNDHISNSITSSTDDGSSNSEQNNLITTRPKRLTRPRVFDDTITGEWWKTSRGSSSTKATLQENLNGNQESAMVSILSIPEPQDYNEAKHSPHWDEWKKAFDDEIASLEENKVWQLVPRPDGRKIIKGKWVCKIKGNAQGE